MSKQLLTVSTSPHMLGCRSVRSMHVEFMLALLPALAMAVYYFGVPALITVCLTVVSAVVTEVVATKLTKMDSNKTDDLHAVLMGLLLGMILPQVAPGVEDSCPWWLPVIGGMLTVVLGKLLFGGYGNYPMHPVIIAWAALSLSWPEHMAAFLQPIPWSFGADEVEWAVSTTPLMDLKDGGWDMLLMPELAPLWRGEVTSAVGTGATWALLIGGVYLVARRIVPWQIPVGVLIGTAAIAILSVYTDAKFQGIFDAESLLEPILPPDIFENLDFSELPSEYLSMAWLALAKNAVWFHLAAGGTMIAAFFLAPEPVTSPVTGWGMFLFGLGVGAMAVIVRTWGGLLDGAFYGVLLMNACTPLFDRIRPRVFGKVVHSA